MPFRARTLPVVALTVLALAGCSSTPSATSSGSGSSASPASGAASVDSGSTAGFPLTITNCGHKLTFKAPPKRTVSLNQSSTEIQLSLGVGSSMVGTATWTDPVLPNLKAANDKVPRLADNAASLDSVIATNPDFVTASFPSTLTDKVSGGYQKYASLGVPAYLAPNQCGKETADSARSAKFTMNEIYQEVTDLAKIHGVPDKGVELNSQLQKRMAAVQRKKGSKPITVVFWFANSEAPYVAGGTGASQLVADHLGLTNIYSSQADEWPQVSWEDLAAKNPDIIVMGDLTRKSQTAETAAAKIAYLKKNPVTAQMTAVKENRFIKVAGGDMNPSIRTVDLAEKVS